MVYLLVLWMRGMLSLQGTVVESHVSSKVGCRCCVWNSFLMCSMVWFLGFLLWMVDCIVWSLEAGVLVGFGVGRSGVFHVVYGSW
ncbi:hypothetical protein M758_1G172800 [Ceratodon purpureus]|uniref:Transmembrane protein n=1 Tax=Ceratodon purpureus TaxID=3225 RepID=A0A8T0J9M3_CERPU|nr:hypothetical protein KC19_1G176200 [Ceratodon purpureus]KAG0630361.1 hypothetical protein M758_1G172800 [Ceratodon purpureus]